MARAEGQFCQKQRHKQALWSTLKETAFWDCLKIILTEVTVQNEQGCLLKSPHGWTWLFVFGKKKDFWDAAANDNIDIFRFTAVQSLVTRKTWTILTAATVNLKKIKVFAENDQTQKNLKVSGFFFRLNFFFLSLLMLFCVIKKKQNKIWFWKSF